LTKEKVGEGSMIYPKIIYQVTVSWLARAMLNFAIALVRHYHWDMFSMEIAPLLSIVEV